MLMRLTMSVAAVVATLIVLLVTQADRQIAMPGTSTIVTVWSIGDGTDSDRAAFRSAAERAASEVGIAVYKLRSNVSSEGWTERLYPLNPAASICFPAAERGRIDGAPVRPFSELPDSQLTGQWNTDVGRATAERFAERLRSAGAEVSVLPVMPLGRVFWAIDTTPVAPITICLGVTLLVGLARWRLDVAREDSILRVHGSSRAAVELRRAGQIVMTGFAAAVPCAGIGSLVAMAVVGRAFASQFLTTAAVGFVVVLAVAASMSYVIGALNGQRREHDRIVGATAPVPLAATAAASAAVSVFVAVGMTVVSVSVAGAAVQNEAERADWDSAASAVVLAWRVTPQEYDRTEAHFIDMARALDDRGDVILAIGGFGEQRGYDPDGGNVLAVNSRFLDTQDVRDADGARIRADRLATDRISVIAPEPFDDPRRDIARADLEDTAIRDTLASWADLALERPYASTATAARILRAAAHQRVFDYGTEEADRSSSRVDPLIIVVPDAFDTLGRDDVGAALSRGEVLFRSAATLRTAMNEFGLDTASVEIEHARDRAAGRFVDIEREFGNSLVATSTSGAAALFALAVQVSMLGSRRRRRDSVSEAFGAHRHLGLAVLVGSSTGVIAVGLIAAHITGDVWGPHGAAAATSIAALLAVAASAFAAAGLRRASPVPEGL